MKFFFKKSIENVCGFDFVAERLGFASKNLEVKVEHFVLLLSQKFPEKDNLVLFNFFLDRILFNEESFIVLFDKIIELNFRLEELSINNRKYLTNLLSTDLDNLLNLIIENCKEKKSNIYTEKIFNKVLFELPKNFRSKDFILKDFVQNGFKTPIIPKDQFLFLESYGFVEENKYFSDFSLKSENKIPNQINTAYYFYSSEMDASFSFYYLNDKYFLFTISREQVDGDLSQKFIGSFSFNQFIDKLNVFLPNIKSLKNKTFLYNNI